MNYKQVFKLAVMLGVVVNVILAAIALLAPNAFLSMFRLDPAYPNIWLRFAALLLILLSLFYLPGALDVDRYRANAWLSILSRAAGVLFFVACVLLLGFSRRFLLFSVIDLFFALLTWLLLMMAIRSPRHPALGAAPLRTRKGEV